jgi:tetratricopeptide (TPR) repeat protein
MAETTLRFPLKLALAALVCLGLASPARAQGEGNEPGCGSLETHYGPFDFRRTTPYSRQIVERAHFNRGVETLTKGITGPLGGDIWYTLSVYPNHPRALLAMERLAEREKKSTPVNSRYSIDCLYERAMRFKPDDHVVRMLFANFLLKQGKRDEALQHLDYVVTTTAEDPFAQFNAGMLYTDMKLYDKALQQAHKVIAMGLTRPELRDRLTAVGQWVEPPAPAASAASSPASGP